MDKKTPRQKPVCPKCGLPYDWIEKRKVGGREYLLAVHVVKDGDKKGKRIHHYLGPKDRYVFAKASHSFMELRGFALDKASDVKRLVDYLRNILDTLTDKEFYGGDEELYNNTLKEVRQILEIYMRRAEASDQGG
jgi:hypothetical protein